MYLFEGDEWRHRPLHIELLSYLKREDVLGAVVLHAVGGFVGRGRVHTSSLVEAGGKLPIVLIFVDHEEHVNRVLPTLREMAPKRLIIRETVQVEQGLE
jgi:PII-like signaling protein